MENEIYVEYFCECKRNTPFCVKGHTIDYSSLRHFELVFPMEHPSIKRLQDEGKNLMDIIISNFLYVTFPDGFIIEKNPKFNFPILSSKNTPPNWLYKNYGIIPKEIFLDEIIQKQTE